MIGKQILSYKIESVLGEGGMGTVYLGVHTQLGRKVAVKMLHPNLSKNASLRERFKNEASALAHLHQPNIVTLFDYYESEEGLFLVMEYVDGMELADHINNVSGPIDEKSAIHYFSQILEAFSYAHNKKVVHRDIKPSNILITKENDIKIMDFGIAKIMDSQKSLTKTGTQMGTVFYMSPEQVNGQKIDHRSDIYSLGVTLFQMITGQCPYNNDTTEFQIYSHIINDPLPDLKSFYPGASEHLAQLIAKATQKNVEDRFQSCEEFKKALNETTYKTDLKKPVIAKSSKIESKASIKKPIAGKAATAQPNESKKKKYTVIIFALVLLLIIRGGFFLIEKTNLFENKNDKKESPSKHAATPKQIINLIEYTNYIYTTSSSQLGNYEIYDYSSNNVIKKDLKKWWSPKRNDRNPWIELSWGSKMLIHGINIHGGAHYKEFYSTRGKFIGDLYYMNKRVKRIKIQFDDGTSFTTPLKDIDKIQEIVFEPIKTNSMKIYILDYYNSEKWEDICVSFIKPLIEDEP